MGPFGATRGNVFSSVTGGESLMQTPIRIPLSKIHNFRTISPGDRRDYFWIPPIEMSVSHGDPMCSNEKVRSYLSFILQIQKSRRLLN